MLTKIKERHTLTHTLTFTLSKNKQANRYIKTGEIYWNVDVCCKNYSRNSTICLLDAHDSSRPPRHFLNSRNYDAHRFLGAPGLMTWGTLKNEAACTTQLCSSQCSSSSFQRLCVRSRCLFPIRGRQKVLFDIHEELLFFMSENKRISVALICESDFRKLTCTKLRYGVTKHLLGLNGFAFGQV